MFIVIWVVSFLISLNGVFSSHFELGFYSIIIYYQWNEIGM